MKIEAEILPVSVEIDGAAHPVVAKTIAVVDRLAKIAAQPDKPKYQVWLEQLRVILGAPAVAKMFPGRKNEDIDRLEHIHTEAMAAFNYNGMRLRKQREQAEVDHLHDLADTLSVIAGKVKEINAKYPGIMRPREEQEA
jgi:hypothetical protein